MQDDKHTNITKLERSLRSEHDRLVNELDQLRKEIALKESECSAKEKRLGHVRALLSTDPQSDDPLPDRSQSRTRSTPSPRLLDLAEQVLRERDGEPMHYRELADELMRRGAVIRGKDPAAALVSRMTQDDNRRAEDDRRFVRPTSKGFYALRENYPDARNVGARRRRNT